jgi:hypothetical protein
MRRIAIILLVVLFGAVALIIKSGLEADHHISRCLDESSPSYISDKDARQTACK